MLSFVIITYHYYSVWYDCAIYIVYLCMKPGVLIAVRVYITYSILVFKWIANVQSNNDFHQK